MGAETSLRPGGVAVFPADTVYGLACDASRRGCRASASSDTAARCLRAGTAARRRLAPLGERTQTVLDELLPDQ